MVVVQRRSHTKCWLCGEDPTSDDSGMGADPTPDDGGMEKITIRLWSMENIPHQAMVV